MDTVELIFEDVRVPVSNLLGEEGKGFYYMMEKLPQERLKRGKHSENQSVHFKTHSLRLLKWQHKKEYRR
jgi:hypothetical protein